MEFARYTVGDLIVFSGNVVTVVTGYAPAAAIKPTPAVVQAAIDDLVSKNQAAMNGGRTERMERNGSKGTLIDYVRSWATYVDFIADGDVMVVLNCGFQPRRASTPSVTPATPSDFRLVYGKLSGEMMLRCKGGRNVRNFSVQYALSVDGPWIDRPLTTKARGTLVPGLTPGTMYWFRMRANGAAGSSDWTVPTCKIAI